MNRKKNLFIKAIDKKYQIYYDMIPYDKDIFEIDYREFLLNYYFQYNNIILNWYRI